MAAAKLARSCVGGAGSVRGSLFDEVGDGLLGGGGEVGEVPGVDADVDLAVLSNFKPCSTRCPLLSLPTPMMVLAVMATPE